MYKNNKEYTIAPQCPWYEAQQSYGPPNVNWCETTRCSWINEPANTWSNLSYMIAGIYIYQKLTEGADRLLKEVGIAVFIMGLFSGIYHATNNFYTQFYDFLGMYIMTSLVMAVFVKRVQGQDIRNHYSYFWMFLFFNTFIFWAFYINDIAIQFTVAINAVLMTGLEFVARMKEKKSPALKYYWSSLVAIAVAQVFSLMDLKRIWCEPENIFLHGHAIWHLFGGVSMLFLGFHIRECLRTQKETN